MRTAAAVAGVRPDGALVTQRPAPGVADMLACRVVLGAREPSAEARTLLQGRVEESNYAVWLGAAYRNRTDKED
jgi:hypothetical protein